MLDNTESLSEPMLTHHQSYHKLSWCLFLNSLRPSDAYMCQWSLTSIGSDNGLSPGRRQSIIKTNAGILLIRPLGTNFSEILMEIVIFSFKKKHLKVSSAKKRPFCLSLNVLSEWSHCNSIHINSLAPADRCIKIQEYLNFSENFCQHILCIFCEIALGWMPIISSQHWFR